jgi:hypothetical protein
MSKFDVQQNETDDSSTILSSAGPSYQTDDCHQWRIERGGGGWGFKTPPRNSKVLQSRTGLQIERKIFSVPIPAS